MSIYIEISGGSISTECWNTKIAENSNISEYV